MTGTTADTIPVLSVRGMRTEFGTEDNPTVAVDGISFDIRPGEVIGLVGESGCGKSATAASILRLLPASGRITGGEILYKGRDVRRMDREELRELRGAGISMVFQDPMSSLNPVLQVGEQIQEVIDVHTKDGNHARKASMPRAVELMEQVRIPSASERDRDYPHQFSGGMRQRIMIAMGVANSPELIIADEPTTALDVTVQAQIIDLLGEMNRETGTAILLITHNVALVSEFCDRMIVMYAGRIVEEGLTDDVISNPQHPYTWSLLRTAPALESSSMRRLPTIEGLPPNLSDPPSGCRFHPRCPFAQKVCTTSDPPEVWVDTTHRAACHFTMSALQPMIPLAAESRIESSRMPETIAKEPLIVIDGLSKSFSTGGTFSGKKTMVPAVNQVSFDIIAGETLALVGESGSGKSTLGRLILRLEEPTAGRVLLDGIEITTASRSVLRTARRSMQMIFQDSHASLDPRLTVEEIIAEPLRNAGVSYGSKRRKAILEIMELCGLPRSYINRYPHEFSGGQRQRIGIARALVLRPRFVVADEPVSALDVSIQGQIINLLKDLQEELNLTYLFISHDLSVVRHIADRVAVMYHGNIVEFGDIQSVFETPQQEYTQALLAAAPQIRRTRTQHMGQPLPSAALRASANPT